MVRTASRSVVTYAVLATTLGAILLTCGGWFAIECWARQEHALQQGDNTQREFECDKAQSKGHRDSIQLRVEAVETDISTMQGDIKTIHTGQIQQQFMMLRIEEEQKAQRALTERILEKLENR